MRKKRDWLKRFLIWLLPVLLIYVLCYVVLSATGGYWMIPARDGKVRYSPEHSGMSLPVAILWQPRIGHSALGEDDLFGVIFGPLIAADRAWIHPTRHLLGDSVDIDAWIQNLPPSKVHPKFRAEFERTRKDAMPATNLSTTAQTNSSTTPK